MEVEISKLVPLPSSANMMDEKTFNILVERVKTEGIKVVEPIIVCRPPKEYIGRVLKNCATGDEVECRIDSYVVVDGWHRVAACKRAGISKIPAVEIASDDVVADGFIANLVRGEICWPLFYRVYRRGEIGKSMEKISKVADVKCIAEAGEVSEKVIDYMVEAERRGTYKFSPKDILLVSKLSDPELQQEFASAIVSITNDQGKKELLKSFMLRENVKKTGLGVEGKVEKKIVDMLKRGELRSSRAVEAIAKSDVWVREELAEALKKRTDGEVDLVREKVVEEKARERDELIKALPDEARAKAEEYKSMLSVRALKAALKIPDPKQIIYFIEEVVQRGYSDSEAENAAEEILEQMRSAEKKVPPLTRATVLEDQVFYIKCPKCGEAIEAEIRFHRTGEPFAEIFVHEKVGEEVHVKASDWQEKKFEEQVVECGRRLRIKVDYISRTLTVEEDKPVV